jgi:hypothetical protein
MRQTTIFIITGAMLFLFSCSKAEMVNGTYKGTATGDYIGTNEPARLELTVYGGHSVNATGYFTGLTMEFGLVQITGPENGQYILSSGTIDGTIKNSDIYLHYSHIPNPGLPTDIVFNGKRQ